MSDSLAIHLNNLTLIGKPREYCFIVDEFALLRTGGHHITKLYVCCPCSPPSILESNGGLFGNLVRNIYYCRASQLRTL